MPRKTNKAPPGNAPPAAVTPANAPPPPPPIATKAAKPAKKARRVTGATTVEAPIDPPLPFQAPAPKPRKVPVDAAEKERLKAEQKKVNAERKRALADERAAKAEDKIRNAESLKTQAREQQDYPRVKQVIGEAPGPFPHDAARAKRSDGPDALVRVSYRVRGRVDETVFMVRRGNVPVTRERAHTYGVALASRSDAAADGYWLSLRDSRYWQPTVYACRMAPHVVDDVGGAAEADDDVDLVVPDAICKSLPLEVWRWTVHTLLGAKLDENVNWRARVPKSMAALAVAVLGIKK